MYERCLIPLMAVLLIIAMSTPGFAAGERPAQGASANANVIKYKPGLKTQDLAGRPDSDVVQLSNGKTISVGKWRQLDALAKKLRAPRVDRTPAALKVTQAQLNARPVKMKLNNASDISAALKIPDDNAVVQLPSGKRATVGQIKLVQPFVERKLGMKLSTIPSRAVMTGPAVHVDKNTPVSEWQKISKMPDNTVLEANGARITIGEFRQLLPQYARTHGIQPKKMPKKGEGQERRVK